MDKRLLTIGLVAALTVAVANPAAGLPKSGAAPVENITTPPVLPWAHNLSLLNLLIEHRTPVLLASYLATLPEPILAERYNIAHAARQLSGYVIQPGEIFSQNRVLGPYIAARGYQAGPTYSGNRIITSYGGGVCKIASLLYNVAILSNLKIIQRHNHSLTVPYVPPGQDATVAYGVRDIKFLNDTGGPILIWAEARGNALYLAFYGRRQPPKITWGHQTLHRYPYWPEYHFSSRVAPGTDKVIMPGMEGLVVKNWLVINQNGRSERRDLGVDYYSPSPRIVEIGLPRSINN